MIYDEQCQCMAGGCGGVDGCLKRAERTVVGEEASLDLCRDCANDHADEALAVVEAA